MSPQPGRFLESIIRLLMPFFLGAAADIDAARADILHTLASYGARTRTELLHAAQIIAFSMSTLETLAEAKDGDLSPNMRLRLRGCANGLSRSGQQNEKALDQSLAYDPPAPVRPTPEAAPIKSTIQPAPSAAGMFHPNIAPVASSLPQSQPAPAKPMPGTEPPHSDYSDQIWIAAMKEVFGGINQGTPATPTP